MPASQEVEDKLLALLLEEKGWTAAKSYLGLSTLAPSALKKTTTAKEFGEHEPTEGNGWVRKTASSIGWTKELGTGTEGEAIYRKWKNTGAVTLSTLTGGEYKLETVAVLEKAKQTEDPAENKGIWLFGKLVTPVTINVATSGFEFKAGELIFELL